MTNQFPLRENVGGDTKVYLFWKSLEQCDQKYLEPYVHKCLEELEEKWNITHSEAVADYVRMTKSQQGNITIDPLVPVILGDKRDLGIKEILDFLESDLFMIQHRNPIKETAFIDLCVILGDHGRAEKCAERFGRKNYALLDTFKDNKEGTLLHQDIMTNNIISFHTSDKNYTNDSGHLTSTILYIMEHIEDKTLSSKISRLWWLQYYWDAICLGTILLPGNPIVDHWKSTLDSLFGNAKHRISWINATRHAINLKNGSSNIAKGHYDHFDPFVAYRFLKIEIAQLHNSHPHKEDLAYLTEIQCKTEALQKLVARLLVTPEPCLAEIVASDAIEFIKNTVQQNWTDYFPQSSRLAYEPGIHMVAYFSAALKHLRPSSLGPYSSARYRFTTDLDFKSGIMKMVVSHWLKMPMGKEIWLNGSNATSLWHQFQRLLDTLRGIEATDSYHERTAILALRLISYIAGGEMTKENEEKIVSQACKDSNITEDQFISGYRQAVITDFDPNPATWVVQPEPEESVSDDTSGKDARDVQHKNEKLDGFGPRSHRAPWGSQQHGVNQSGFNRPPHSHETYARRGGGRSEPYAGRGESHRGFGGSERGNRGRGPF